MRRLGVWAAGLSTLPAIAAFGAALGLAFLVADIAHPAVIFPKYLAAAAALAAEQSERLLDYSPLYLAFVGLLLPLGPAAILAVQAVLHAATAAMAAVTAGRLGGRGSAWIAGLGVASYRPFLTYSGIHEPETLILACLAAAILLGVVARERLGSVAGQAAGGLPAAETRAGASAGTPGDMPAGGEAPTGTPVSRSGAASPAGRRRASGLTAIVVILAFGALAAAALGRPQYLLLVPVWAVWLGGALPPRSLATGGGNAERFDPPGLGAVAEGEAVGAAGGGGVAPPGSADATVKNGTPGRRSHSRWLWAAALLVPVVVVGPPVLARARATGVPTIMNPGAVLYEGNGPGATGLTRFAPPAVIELERAHRESIDYGHVAYRRIAALALGHPVGPPAANRYWTALAVQAAAARPAAALRLLGRKALMALMPYEGHDLRIAEQLDRRLRPWLPWGFALPLATLPWLVFTRRRRLVDLAGPLAIVALAVAVQTVTYASARQRLPAALALWIVGPALASDLLSRRLRAALSRRPRTAVRPVAALLVGIGLVLCLAAATSRVAVLDQAGWDGVLGREPRSAGTWLCAAADGRLLRPGLAREAEDLGAGIDLYGERRPAEALRRLAPLLGHGSDLTVDDRRAGVPDYWAALALLALGRRPEAAAMAEAASAARPEDERIGALALRLSSPAAAFARRGDSWRPPGADPASVRMALGAAAVADGDGAAALALWQPLAASLPELTPRWAPARRPLR
jgi:hypothetical protein